MLFCGRKQALFLPPLVRGGDFCEAKIGGVVVGRGSSPTAVSSSEPGGASPSPTSAHYNVQTKNKMLSDQIIHVAEVNTTISQAPSLLK